MSPSSVWEDIGPFRAMINPAQRSPELAIALAGLSARLNQGVVEVLREEPYRTIRIHLTAGRSERDVVIQLFPEQGVATNHPNERSLGAHAYAMALNLDGLGIGVPAPIACLERRSGQRVLGSYFVTEHVDGGRSFDHELARLFREEPDFEVMAGLVSHVALAVRSMHGLGVFHRSLGNRCIIIGPGAPNRPPRILFTDLFRARSGRVPGIREQARDLSGLSLPPRLWRVLLDAYWGGASPRLFDHWECVCRAGRRLTVRIPALARLRGPARVSSRLPAISEQWLWDRDTQSAVNMGNDPARPIRMAEQRVRLIEQFHAAHIVANVFGEPVPLDHILAAGILDPSALPAADCSFLGDLGIRDVMVRFCHHESPAGRRMALAAVQQMAQSGFSVSGVLVQDRKAVCDPAAWMHFVNQILGCVGWQLRRVEFGHAVNRTEWGVRTLPEYGGLVGRLPEVQNAYPGVSFAGPGVDGFDYRFARHSLRLLPPGCRWDAFPVRIGGTSSWYALSDDGLIRRCAGLAAVIGRSGNCLPHLIVSEMARENMGGAADAAWIEAARLARRILLLTCSGLVDQTVLWWLPGVVSKGDVKDPAVQALVRMRAVLAGGRFVRRLSAGDSRRVFLLHCETVAAQPVMVAWVDGPPCQVKTPFRISSAEDLFGKTAPLLPYPRVRLTAMPVFFHG